VLWKAIEDQQQVRGTFYFWIPTIWVALVWIVNRDSTY
jgi:hypothetical protein